MDEVTPKERDFAMELTNTAWDETVRLRLSSADQKLRQRRGDKAAACVYIMRSFHILVEEAARKGNVNLAEIENLHEHQCQMMRKILNHHFKDKIPANGRA